ncbi:DUF1330 domain-containing protein [Shewanella sp. MF05960]|uniref:DUF1330 domain-containing protein n=1 Tax=Shewanella sp. MF05960 TaxID=3434874 RepID=UPI003D79850C
MSAFFIINYDVTEPEMYAKYNPGSNSITAGTVAKHGGTILAASGSGIDLMGQQGQIKVIIEFPNSQAAKAWLDDPEYAPAKAIRLAATDNINQYIVDGLMP